MLAALKWKRHKFRTKHHSYYMTSVDYSGSNFRRRCSMCGKVF